MVCWSVCLSVMTVSAAKKSEPIETSFGMWNSGGPKELCIRWGPDRPLEAHCAEHHPQWPRHQDFPTCCQPLFRLPSGTSSRVSLNFPIEKSPCDASFHQMVSPLVMAALCNRGGALYFCPVVSFYLLSIYLSLFFSSPNLSGHTSDVYHTSTHGVALVRI